MLTNDQMIAQLESIPGLGTVHFMFMFGVWNCSCEYIQKTPDGEAGLKAEFKGRDRSFSVALLQMYNLLMKVADGGFGPDFGAPMLELQADEHEVAKRDIEG